LTFRDDRFRFSGKNRGREKTPPAKAGPKKRGVKPSKGGVKKTTARQDQKFQITKLVRSGRTLNEAMAQTKGVAVGLFSEYGNRKEEDAILDIEGTLHRLTRTRGQAISLAKLRFGRRRALPKVRNEFIAEWLTDGPKINWKRDGNLVAKGPPTPSRPGSSKQIPIGKTKFIGPRRVARDFKAFINALKKLGVKDGKGIAYAITKRVRVR